MKGKISGIIAVLACMAGFYFWQNRNPYFPEIQDEGNASAAVVLRIKGKAGEKSKSAVRGEYTVPDAGLSGAFTATSEDRVAGVAGGVVESISTIGPLRMERDDLVLGPVLKDSLGDKRIVASYNARGNVIKFRGVDGLTSFNFPAAPVKVNDTWAGYKMTKGQKQKLEITLEEIIKYRGHDVAVLDIHNPSNPDEADRHWIDVDTGSFIRNESRTYAKTADAHSITIRVKVQQL